MENHIDSGDYTVDKPLPEVRDLADMVQEFREMTNADDNQPAYKIITRLQLLNEEMNEFTEVAIMYHRRGAEYLPLLIKEACDIVYIVVGLFSELGLPFMPFFAEVHRSNMSKANGYWKNGKWIKPMDYKRADIESVLRDYTQTSADERTD